MARIRSIKPELTMDEELSELGFATRYFFINLWCHCDREGRCEDRPKMLQAKILPWDSKVDADQLLKELHPHFVLRYEVEGKKYLLVRNFLKHQRPKDEEQKSVIPAPSKELMGVQKVSQEYPKGIPKVAPKPIGELGVEIGDRGVEIGDRGVEIGDRGVEIGEKIKTIAANAASVQKQPTTEARGEKTPQQQLMDWYLPRYHPFDPPGQKSQRSIEFGKSVKKILEACKGDVRLAKDATADIINFYVTDRGWKKEKATLHVVGRDIGAYIKHPQGYRPGYNAENGQESFDFCPTCRQGHDWRAGDPCDPKYVEMWKNKT